MGMLMRRSLEEQKKSGKKPEKSKERQAHEASAKGATKKPEAPKAEEKK